MPQTSNFKKFIYRVLKDPAIPEKTKSFLKEHFYNSCRILGNLRLRNQYLDNLKIRSFCNQLSRVSNFIDAYQCGRVFPWMIFKVLHQKTEHILEVDCVKQYLKLTNCVSKKIIFYSTMDNFKGILTNPTYPQDLTIQLSFLYDKDDHLIEIAPFYTG